MRRIEVVAEYLLRARLARVRQWFILLEGLVMLAMLPFVLLFVGVVLIGDNIVVVL